MNLVATDCETAKMSNTFGINLGCCERYTECGKNHILLESCPFSVAHHIILLLYIGFCLP